MKCIEGTYYFESDEKGKFIKCKVYVPKPPAQRNDNSNFIRAVSTQSNAKFKYNDCVFWGGDELSVRIDDFLDLDFDENNQPIVRKYIDGLKYFIDHEKSTVVCRVHKDSLGKNTCKIRLFQNCFLYGVTHKAGDDVSVNKAIIR